MGGQRDKMGVIEHQIDKKIILTWGDTLFIPEKRHRSHLCSKGTEFNFDILSPFCTLALPVHV